MGTIRTIYKDKAGNKLREQWIKTRNVNQYSAVNADGRLVDTKGVKHLLKKAGVRLTKIKEV